MAIDSVNPLSYSAANPGQLPTEDNRTEKFLLFAVGKLNLALPIARVMKILPHTPIHGTGISDMGVINLEDQSLSVIDLHRRLFNSPQPAGDRPRQYLILVKNHRGEAFCLGVNEAPTLVDVPRKQMRKLPESYRQHDSLRCASHVLIVQQQGQQFTVFLLDPDLLL